MKLKKLLAGITTFAIAATAVMTPFGTVLPLPTAVREASAAQVYYDDDFSYTILDDGTVSISGYDGDDDDVMIPSEIDGMKVTAIADYAFMENSDISSVTIPSGVKSIGSQAFYWCQDLESVTIPNSVTSIGSQAFYMCMELTSVTVPSKLTSIKDGTFGYCTSLKKIAIPSSVKSIGDHAFEACQSLETITIPDSVTSLGTNAFDSCIKLTSAVVGNGVKSISDHAFNECSSLKTVTIGSGATSIDSYAFFECGALASVSIKGKLTSIGICAFDGCKKLKTINIPDALKYIGNNAFWYCAFTSIILPVSLTSVGDYAFYGCSFSDVYYTGSEAQWNKISVGEYNSALKTANKHYNYSSGTSSLSAPTGLKLKGRASNALRIGWNKNTSADGYIVEMYKGGKWVRVAKITKNTTVEWRQSGLAAGTAHKFRVKAYKMNGSTATYSSYVNISARTNPSNVTGLKVLGKAKDALRIGWTKNTSADGYIVEMYSGGKWVRVQKITKNSTVQYRKAGLKKGTTYKFRVKAYKMSGSTALYSGYTSISAVTTK